MASVSCAAAFLHSKLCFHVSKSCLRLPSVVFVEHNQGCVRNTPRHPKYLRDTSLFPFVQPAVAYTGIQRLQNHPAFFFGPPMGAQKVACGLEEHGDTCRAALSTHKPSVPRVVTRPKKKKKRSPGIRAGTSISQRYFHTTWYFILFIDNCWCWGGNGRRRQWAFERGWRGPRRRSPKVFLEIGSRLVQADCGSSNLGGGSPFLGGGVQV